MTHRNLLLAVLALWSAGCVSVPDESRTGDVREAAMINVQLGAEYLRQGNVDLARDKLERALEQDPRLPEAHLTMAHLESTAGNAQRAEQGYRRALALRRNDPDIRNAYGVFLCRQDRLKDAEQHLLAAARNTAYQTPEIAWTNAGVCAEKEPDLAKAERYYREALRMNSRHHDALWQLARVSFDAGKPLQARGFLQRYLDLGPQMRTAPALWLGYQVEVTLGDEAAAQTYAARLRSDHADSGEMRQLREAERARGR